MPRSCSPRGETPSTRLSDTRTNSLRCQRSSCTLVECVLSPAARCPTRPTPIRPCTLPRAFVTSCSRMAMANSLYCQVIRERVHCIARLARSRTRMHTHTHAHTHVALSLLKWIECDSVARHGLHPACSTHDGGARTLHVCAAVDSSRSGERADESGCVPHHVYPPLPNTLQVFVEALSVCHVALAGTDPEYRLACAAEATWVSEQLATSSKQYALVPTCALEDPDVATVLDEYATLSGFKGIRQITNKDPSWCVHHAHPLTHRCTCHSTNHCASHRMGERAPHSTHGLLSKRHGPWKALRTTVAPANPAPSETLTWAAVVASTPALHPARQTLPRGERRLLRTACRLCKHVTHGTHVWWSKWPCNSRITH
jgi:hypothetical protein